jgi:hypothetical protein
MSVEAKKIDLFSISAAINGSYNKEGIAAFYRAFLRKFILANAELCRKNRVPVNLVEIGGNIKKGDYTDILAPFFTYGELFRAILKQLPDPLPQILAKIVWEGPQNHEDLEREFKTKIAYTQDELKTKYVQYPHQELDPFYCIFKDEHSYKNHYWSWGESRKQESAYHHSFTLDTIIRQNLQNFLDKPVAFHLLPLRELPESELIYEDNNTIFTELPVLVSYIQQGKLSISETGKLVAGSLNKMRKYCSIREFYTEGKDNTLLSLRTRLLCEVLLLLLEKEKMTYEDPALYIREGFRLYGKDIYAGIHLLLHLKGLSHVGDTSGSNQVILNLLKEMPLMQWVSIDNLVKFCLYRNISIRPFPESLGHTVYFEAEGHYGKERQYVRRDTYQLAVVEPLLKASLMLFAAFGLVDVAYSDPVNPKAARFDKEYISVFDGIRHIRLTSLGAFVCGLQADYATPAIQETKVVLDENNLFISYTGDSKPLLAILEKVARKAGDFLYKVDYESLLGDCNTQKEIDAKINIFKQLLSNNPPQIWKDFFDTLHKKSYKIYSQEEEYKVFKLPDDRELIRLIASDDFLKKNVIKAEMYYVIIPKANVNKVKTYLKKWGFLIDFS